VLLGSDTGTVDAEANTAGFGGNEGGHDVHDEPGSARHVAGDEVGSSVHETRDNGDIVGDGSSLAMTSVAL